MTLRDVANGSVEGFEAFLQVATELPALVELAKDPAKLAKKAPITERAWTTRAGLEAIVRRMVHLGEPGFRCGYVRLPEGHPWHGVHNETVPAGAHGGVTWAGPCPRVRASDASPAGWWIGFDTHHFDSSVTEWTEERTALECESLAQQAKAAQEQA